MEEGYKYDHISIRGESLIVKIARLIAVMMFVGMLLLMFACKKERDEDATVTGKGLVDVQMQMQTMDIPQEYLALDMDIRSVQFHYADDNNEEQQALESSDSWVSLKTNAGVYDLLRLRHNSFAIICREEGIQGKKINGMKLVLGDRHGITVRTEEGDTVRYPMIVASDAAEGLSLNLDTKIFPGQKLVFWIEIEMQHVIADGSGDKKYLLKPVVRLKNISHR